MKCFVIITIIVSLFACKQSTSISEVEPITTDKVIEPTVIKEAIFITMERTPCFGKCPSYLITIFNTGRVIYEGRDFSERQGKYTSRLTSDQLDELKNNIEAIDLFNLKDKYDQHVTDIPSCFLYVQLDGKKKKIMDRVGTPQELRNFEKLIDFLVINDRLIKVEEE